MIEAVAEKAQTGLKGEIAIDRLYIQMREDGYEVGAPSDEVEELDGLIFEGGPCGRCGGKVGFHPFHRGRQYRPFVVCPLCGWEREV